ncbi:MAG: CDP-diacylglycerol--glycerol-3-phosphate 3-phosphatidyltransferase [Octadecabacter sp.]|jgi:cardiolipin synthase|nr:CDP-diacylglycerol--glycerol-3-phosphate 3-phosphatidyltransferase [Octadecabacter sp.]
MTWNIPNILTLLRLLAAPGVAIMFLYFARPWADWFALVLFVVAATTDWVDGYLARAWNQQTKFGAMLDPIADKVMVVIALLVICGFSGMDPWILLPGVLIMFRETFVSGLREFLGDTAGTLKVTPLAKWKTAAQMTAIAVLFSTGAFETYFNMSVEGMDDTTIEAVFAGDLPDEGGIVWKFYGTMYSWWIGITLLWISMALTVITGADYLRKAAPFLKED